MNGKQTNASTSLLIKLRPSHALKAAESRVNLRPLYNTPQAKRHCSASAPPPMVSGDLPGEAANPWDIAHARVAGRLGVAETDVIFIEPDIIHSIFPDSNEREAGQTFAIGGKCISTPQDGEHGKVCGPMFSPGIWGDDYTQLGKARDAVKFTEPRTRIATSTQLLPLNIVHRLSMFFAISREILSEATAILTVPKIPTITAFCLTIQAMDGTISILAGAKVRGTATCISAVRRCRHSAVAHCG